MKATLIIMFIINTILLAIIIFTALSSSSSSSSTSKSYEDTNQLVELFIDSLDSTMNINSTMNKFQKSNRHEEAKELALININQIAKLRSNNSQKTNNNNNISEEQATTINPFKLIDAYEPSISEEFFNNKPKDHEKYNVPNYGLKNDGLYCVAVDIFNLYHSSRLSKEFYFFTDYPENSLIRKDILEKIGQNLMPKISTDMDPELSKSRKFPINPNITLFYTKLPTFHYYHKINSNFLCTTQMYNHIPGSSIIKRKDFLANRLYDYIGNSTTNQKCFTSGDHFPKTYRLWVQNDCKEFMEIINSKKYNSTINEQPIQYIIKNGYKTSKNIPAKLFDKDLYKKFTIDYGINGEKCGKSKYRLIAQKYISEPLLLDKQNKFILRVFLLISSTNPLIAYYHDGYVLASLAKYDPKNITNYGHIVSESINEQFNQDFHIMSLDELNNYQYWSMKQLNDYLHETGQIKNKTWLRDILRPKLQTSLIHLLRMTHNALYQHSGIFELFAVDFIFNKDLKTRIINVETNMTTAIPKKALNDNLIKIFDGVLKIQFSYYKSRIFRIMKTLRQMYRETKYNPALITQKWKNQYKEMNQNKLLKKYQRSISKTNWTKFIDKSLKGKKAYFNLINNECI